MMEHHENVKMRTTQISVNSIRLVEHMMQASRDFSVYPHTT